MTEETREELLARLDAFEKRVTSIEQGLAENTKATLEGNRDAREILELFQAVKGGMKVLGWLGNALRWVGIVAGAGMACYGLWNAITHPGQQLPKP